MRGPVVLLSLLALLAGCLQSSKNDDAAGADDPPSTAQDIDSLLASLQFDVVPDAERCLTDLEAFVDLAPRRYENQFQHGAAKDWLEEQFSAAGLHVERHAFDGVSQAAGLSGGLVPMAPVPGENIIATLPGRNPSLPPILFGAHYDSAVTAYGAAYDDGSGTLITVELARALAQYEFQHTIVFGLWDQEEAGLVGAERYVAHLKETGANVTLYVNFDMTGINWPAKIGGVTDVALRASFGGVGDEANADLWRAAAAHLGHPAIGSTVDAGATGGSSDHGAFLAADYPAAWVRGALIGNYPMYHNADRVETMVTMVGGDRNDLVAGFDTALQASFLFAFLLDAFATAA